MDNMRNSTANSAASYVSGQLEPAETAPPLHLCAYMRVSMDAAGSWGLAQQCQSILSIEAIKHATELVLLVDAGLSGRIDERPGFQYLVGVVEQDATHAVLVQFADRLARRESILHAFLERCEFNGIVVYDVGNECEISSANAAARASSASSEWELLTNRLREGRELRVKNGSHVGKLPYGLMRGTNGSVVRDPGAERVIRRISKYARAGLLRPAIAAKLNSAGIPTPSQHRGQSLVAPLWSSKAVGDILNREVYRGIISIGLTVTERDFDTGRRRVRPGYAGQVVSQHVPAFRFFEDHEWLEASLTAGRRYMPQPNHKSPRRAFSQIAKCRCAGALRYWPDGMVCKDCKTVIATSRDNFDAKLIKALRRLLPDDERLNQMEAHHDAQLASYVATGKWPDSEKAPFLAQLFDVANADDESVSALGAVLRAAREQRLVLRVPFLGGHDIRKLRETLEPEVGSQAYDPVLANALIQQVVDRVEVHSDGGTLFVFKGLLAGLGSQRTLIDCTAENLPVLEGATAPVNKAPVSACQPVPEFDKVWRFAGRFLERFGHVEPNARDLLESAVRAVQNQTDWGRRPNEGVEGAEVAAFMLRIVRSGAWEAIQSDEKLPRQLRFPARRIEAIRPTYAVAVTKDEYASIDRSRLKQMIETACEPEKSRLIAIDMKLDRYSKSKIEETTGHKQSNVYRLVALAARGGLDQFALKQRMYLYELTEKQVGGLYEAVREGFDPTSPRPPLSRQELFEVALELGAKFPNSAALHAHLDRRGDSFVDLKRRAIAALVQRHRAA